MRLRLAVCLLFLLRVLSETQFSVLCGRFTFVNVVSSVLIQNLCTVIVENLNVLLEILPLERGNLQRLYCSCLCCYKFAEQFQYGATLLFTVNILKLSLLGWDKHSYGYHGDDGHSFCSSGTGQPYGPTFTTGDVIGCCVNLINNTCFYTKNGHSLGTKVTRWGAYVLTAWQ